MSIPNFISIGRLLCVPLTVWLILDGHMTGAFWLFVAAGLSDAIDGFIAKRFNATTELGGYLDPIADKALLVSVYVTLGLTGWLEDWLVILVVFRDLLILGGAILYHMVTQSLAMQPLYVSKINTVCQIALVIGILASAGLDIELEWLVRILVYVVAATTFISGAAYVVTWSRRAATLEDHR